jgi:L-fucose mutarotase
MLRTTLIHPEILKALGSAGHGSIVLIADGNYPFTTGANPLADRVYLNLAPGVLKVTDVMRVLVGAIPIEAIHVMMPDNAPEPAIYKEFREILTGYEMQRLGRFEFYDVARSSNTALVIATGEQRTYACVLLTVGVIAPPAG